MNGKTERRLAAQILHLKEHGYTVPYIIRRLAIQYAILFALLVLCITLNHKGLLLESTLMFMTGLIVGAVARDVGWLRQSKRLWPLYAKIIDWGKLKEIADGDACPAAGGSARQRGID